MLAELILVALLSTSTQTQEAPKDLNSIDMQCEAFFIEENDVKVNLYKTENTKLMYWKMAETLAIRIDMLLIDAKIAVGHGNDELALSLAETIKQNANDIKNLQDKHTQLSEEEAALLERETDIIEKKEKIGCSSPIDTALVGKACPVYPERLNDTIICKSYYYLQKEAEKINGSKSTRSSDRNL